MDEPMIMWSILEDVEYQSKLGKSLKNTLRKFDKEELFEELEEIVARLEELYGASITLSSDKLGENLLFTAQGYCMDNRFAVENENILESVLDIMANILLHPMTENGAFRSDFFAQEKSNHADLMISVFFR